MVPNPSTPDAAWVHCGTCGQPQSRHEHWPVCAYCHANNGPASPLSPPDDGGGDEKVERDVVLAKAWYRQRDEIAVLARRVKTLEEALRAVLPP